MRQIIRIVLWLLINFSLSSLFAGTVITANLPSNTAIINISATQDGAANYNGDQTLWYHPFDDSGTLPAYTIQAGTYYFRIINPTDTANFFPALTSTQTNQIYTGWTYNAPWIENFLVFDSAATNNFSLPQMIYGSPSTVGYGNAVAAYQGAIATGVYNQIRTGSLGSAGPASSTYTFATNETLIFVIPDNGLYDNGGGVSVLISPVDYSANFLLNPGAEADSITNWTRSGVSNPTIDNGSFDFGINPHAGNYDFLGGNGTTGSLSQVVALVGNQGLTTNFLDDGTLTAKISFWEQGLNQGSLSDNAYVSLAFWDSASNVISTVSTPQIDSHNNSWSNYVAYYVIPSGTRYIQYTMNFVREAGSDLDAFVDDNSLTILHSTPRPPLIIVPLGSGMIAVQWPTNFTGFILSQTTNLTSVWSDVPGQPAISNLNYSLTLPLDSANKFFRLHNP